MQTVAVSRTIDATPEAVRDAMTDVAAFMRAAGFDRVTVEGDEIRIANQVGLASIELTLELVDRPDAVLAYEQREGIFRSMETRYTIDERDGQVVVEGITEFAVDVDYVGFLLDATVIERQRRRELEGQFDYLESRTG